MNLASVSRFILTWNDFGQWVLNENVVSGKWITIQLLQIFYTKITVGHTIGNSDRFSFTIMPDARVYIDEVAHCGVVDIQDQSVGFCLAQQICLSPIRCKDVDQRPAEEPTDPKQSEESPNPRM